jgi:hypothetical protein
MRAAVILSWALLLIVQCALADAKPGRVIVDLHAPSAEIRQMLLKHTPVGSSVDSVARFISTQLAVPGSGSPETVPAVSDPSRPRAAKAIRVYLGHYYKHLGSIFLTAPMVVHERVSAQWWFDRHGRLIDIAVDQQASVY